MNSLVKSVLEKRYFLKDENGEVIEDWEGLCERVSKAVTGDGICEYGIFTAQEIEEQFFNVLYNCDFLPNSPTLMSAGINDNFTLSACFVIPVEDSMESIFEAIKQSALISKMGGGCGYNFSTLRPEGTDVGSTSGIASGPLSFIKVFDAATETVKQGGKRRGANMGILRVDHPDIVDFVDSKLEDGEYSNFNFSVGITDEFMKAVRLDKQFALKFNGEIKLWIKARELWNKIVFNAHQNGEPGVIFLDTINRRNELVNTCGPIHATNPCGEQPLYPNECCVLGSINLSNMYKCEWIYDKKCDDVKAFWGRVDKDRLYNAIRCGVIMLDNIIDVQKYPNKDFEKFHKSNRKIGLGVMGFADLLIKCGVIYGSDLSIEIAKSLMLYIDETATIESENLTVEFGRDVPENVDKACLERRNATVTTIAPTGTLSLIAGCSSGIEPNFSYETKHNRVDEKHVTYHPLMKEYLDSFGPHKEIGRMVPKYFIEASQVTVEQHIKMQAAFQESTDNAVSKTINMPSTATVDDVREAYELAFKLGCKGVTVYRDGSRDNQVLSTNEKKEIIDNTKESKEMAKKIIEDFNNREAIPEVQKDAHDFLNQFIDTDELPEVMNSKRIKVYTPEGKIFINISYIDDKPYEVFINHPATTNHAETYESLARLASTCLRAGVSLDEVIDQLTKSHKKYGSVSGLNNALIKALTKFKIETPVVSQNKCKEKFSTDYKSFPEEPKGVLIFNCPKCHKHSFALKDGYKECSECSYKAYELDVQKFLKGQLTCDECGQQSYVIEENCGKCYSCGHSSCS